MTNLVTYTVIGIGIFAYVLLVTYVGFEPMRNWLPHITILAIVLGPILSGLVTRNRDNARAIRARQTAIFQTLMQKRSLHSDSDYLDALNLIETEFKMNKKIINTWEKLHSQMKSTPKDEIERMQHEEDLKDYQVELLHAIAKHLGYDFEQNDIRRGNIKKDKLTKSL